MPGPEVEAVLWSWLPWEQRFEVQEVLFLINAVFAAAGWGSQRALRGTGLRSQRNSVLLQIPFPIAASGTG